MGPHQQGRPISTHMPPAPGPDPRTHRKSPVGGPHSQLEAFGRCSAQYSFYVPGRTSHPGEALSRPRLRKFTNPLRDRTKAPRRQRACNPSHAQRRRLHDAGPGMLETPMERKRPPSEPGVAPSYLRPCHAIVSPRRHTAPPVPDRLPAGRHSAEPQPPRTPARDTLPGTTDIAGGQQIASKLRSFSRARSSSTGIERPTLAREPSVWPSSRPADTG
jgi:hypothetical protein